MVSRLMCKHQRNTRAGYGRMSDESSANGHMALVSKRPGLSVDSRILPQQIVLNANEDLRETADHPKGGRLSPPSRPFT